MSKINKRVLVPYTADQMYGLVNDSSRYPEFLPWCESVRVIEQSESAIKAEVGVSKGKIRQSFTTQNSMVPGERIEMNLVEGPFKSLHGVWTFSPRGEAGCEVSLEMEFEFTKGLLGFGFNKVFSGIASSLVDAFCQRAKTVYGQQNG
ncbi:MAG: type II toxin-antitoxin system RatA family toxin [Gammaproteobacteria bacterium]